METVTVSYIIGLILTFMAFIYSCYVTFKDEKENNQIYSKDYEIDNIEDISTDEKVKYVQLSRIIMQALGTSNINETLEKTCQYYKENGININDIEFSNANPYNILAEIMMNMLGTDNIDDTIDKATEFYRKQGIDIK